MKADHSARRPIWAIQRLPLEVQLCRCIRACVRMAFAITGWVVNRNDNSDRPEIAQILSSMLKHRMIPYLPELVLTTMHCRLLICIINYTCWGKVPSGNCHWGNDLSGTILSGKRLVREVFRVNVLLLQKLMCIRWSAQHVHSTVITVRNIT